MGIKLVIADDHSMIREGLRQLLELDENLKVVAEASDGKEALEKLNKNELVPLPLIVEGKVQYTTLKMIGKNELWLSKILRNNNLELKNIFYAVYKRKELYLINKID